MTSPEATVESPTLQTIDTEYSADSVEWCGIPGYTDLLLCGTYQLEEKQHQEERTSPDQPQVRVGRLYLYRLVNNKDSSAIPTPKLHQLTSVDMPGILDIKWSQQVMGGDRPPLFGLVNSVGHLRIMGVTEEGKNVAMVSEAQVGECLGLSLEWNNTVHQQEEPKVVVSDSAGRLHLYRLCGSGLEVESSWDGHGFEAWIAAFDQWNTNIIMSGGDDCKLKTWDLRVGTDCPIRTSKRHTMGVCSIQSNPVCEHILATGSYDEQLLLWDTRNMKQPITELGLGGGIWRIKWHPGGAANILTATMYNGFHIVDSAHLHDSGPSVKLHYTEHQSIAYGADWCRSDVNTTDDVIIATCSFYDHTLKLWKYVENKS